MKNSIITLTPKAHNHISNLYKGNNKLSLPKRVTILMVSNFQDSIGSCEILCPSLLYYYFHYFYQQSGYQK